MGGQLLGRTFRREQLERTFRRQGFVIVPFIKPDEHQFLESLIDSVVPHEAAFYSTALQPWSADLRHFDRVLTDRFLARVEELFVDHDLRGAYALYKGPSTGPEGGEIPYHQDHSFVDEAKFCGVVVWSPVGQLSPDSRSLSVVPGSHGRFRLPRGSGQTRTEWGHIDRFISKAAVRVHVPFGSALVYDAALIHGSPRNADFVPRRVLGLGIVPRSAQVIRYHEAEPGVVERFDLVDDYFRLATGPPTERPADHIISSSVFVGRGHSSPRRRLSSTLDCFALARQSVAVGGLGSLRRLFGVEQSPWPR